MKTCNVTVDVDTLRSNFNGFGLRDKGYSGREFGAGLGNILDFFSSFKIKATFFFVARDAEDALDAGLVRKVAASGHEIASHTYSHPQGFRFLPESQKYDELLKSKEILERVSGRRVTGFRAPGWNISDDALPILKRLGYGYDSSVFPTYISPLLKVMHYYSMHGREAAARTTLGQNYLAIAPSAAYHTSDDRLGCRGNSAFIEFPVQVAGILRLPFFSTIHLSYPWMFEHGYRSVREMDMINYQMHISDFVDYTTPEFDAEVPRSGGSYRPLSLKVPLEEKIALWSRFFTAISRDFEYGTLQASAELI
jgi:peptidoglycan-N-acetylglucosamine deacetylase